MLNQGLAFILTNCRKVNLHKLVKHFPYVFLLYSNPCVFTYISTLFPPFYVMLPSRVNLIAFVDKYLFDFIFVTVYERQAIGKVDGNRQAFQF